MSSNNKRRLTATPDEEFSAKRRRGERQFGEEVSSAPKNTPSEPPPTPTSRQIARPKRWRKGQNSAAAEAPVIINLVQKPMQPRSQQLPSQSANIKELSAEPSQTALRFSFEGAFDHGPISHTHQAQALNQSFSGLVVTNEANEQTPKHVVKTNSLKDQIEDDQPFRPELSKPKRKREGYGFSYSDTFWLDDSDEYPDTEVDWDLEEESHQPVNTDLTAARQENHRNAEAQEAQISFGGSTVIDGESSFDDFVVIRDVGSFHMARPQKILPCTKATREDAVRLKAKAKTLLGKYKESDEIQAQLLIRLERMVVTEQEKQQTNVSEGTVSILKCTLKISEFLAKVKEERIETGEHRTFVEHELEWVKWLVDASRIGVLHLKTSGCKCRPDWEE